MSGNQYIRELECKFFRYNEILRERTGYSLENVHIIPDPNHPQPHANKKENAIHVPKYSWPHIYAMQDHILVHEMSHLLLSRENPIFNYPYEYSRDFLVRETLSEGFAEYVSLDYFLDTYPEKIRQKAKRTQERHVKMAKRYARYAEEIFRLTPFRFYMDLILYADPTNPQYANGYYFFHKLAEKFGKHIPFKAIKTIHELPIPLDPTCTGLQLL